MGNITVIVITAFVASIVGYILRLIYAKLNIRSAEQTSKRVIEEMKLIAETKAKEIILDARLIVDRERKEFEHKIKERRQFIQNMENKLNQREESLDRKMDAVDKKEKNLSEREKDFSSKEHLLSVKFSEVDKVKEEQKKFLERISGMTREEAKKILISGMEEDAKQCAAVLLQKLEQEMRENADKKSKEILSIAIQRVAADHTADITTSTIQISNDEIKGRIIGREGRNIKAFEHATGVDLIVDDTPESITISAFDGIRRQIAKIALERLIADGRIHPARIEEVVKKVKKDMEQHLKETGEQAVIEAGVPCSNLEIIKLLGKLKYRTSYGQSQLQHTLEVTWLAGAIAGELGLDVMFCKKAALLHDIGKAVDHEVEGTHHQISANIAKKYGESHKMINAILSHHEGFEVPSSPEAFVIATADAISAARPGARKESVERYLKRLEKLEKVVKEFRGVSIAYAMQAGREVRILVEPEKINDNQTQILAHDIAKKIEQELEYPGQIKITVVRETRVQEIAK
ncbi:ribonuclease Y [Endomicrobiia bacterium]|uniref:ribonuclease Y n=1 Tax=Endomicrobium trichonymphae TaxID=1408204 RepID=UPI000864BA1A|nr:ribonuclease Y [Candidatus Endomicrobium trichonymphae]BAV58875.1 putative HD superfamily hydrolase [Candidatus Endomicrobium trichonymphae]GHT08623.1 ribonuclease Y [Endomicrobiia bacterium]GHT15667.1 ribonuclease Y [Endomicrobiia bacterium]